MKWKWLNSDVMEIEVERTANPMRRRRVRLLLARANEVIRLSNDIRDRAAHLTTLGFKPFDALHLASAESAQADVLLSVDHQFVAAGRRSEEQIRVRVLNALIWLAEGAT